MLNHHFTELHSKMPAHRYIFNNADLSKFIEAEKSGVLKDKAKENYDKEVGKLADRIKELEAGGRTSDQIKQTIKEERTVMIIRAVNDALRELKVKYTENGKEKQVTYLYLKTIAGEPYAGKIAGIFDPLFEQSDKDTTTALDTYLRETSAATGKVVSALGALPEVGKRFDPNAENTETQRLKEVLDSRADVLDKSKTSRSEIIQDRAGAYKLRTSIADKMTSPQGGKIDDYDDGHLFDGDQIFWGAKKDMTDENNPTRFLLNGYLYANDIFGGGGADGQAAMEKAIEEPYKLYYRTIGDSRFTMEDFESGMAMKSYLDDARQYISGPSSYRVLGVVAGLLRLTDQMLRNGDLRKQYDEYLRENFSKLGKGDYNTEEKQLQYLFGLQSPAEFFGLNNKWKGDFSKIDHLTDPDAPGAKIDDYPGTYSDNKNSKTRWNLNGYLYANYLFYGKSQGKVDAEFERAVKMFHDHWDGNLLEQEQIEKKAEGNTDGFGLGSYLSAAEQYTKHEQVKGLIAGLLKLTDDMSDTEQAKAYSKYLNIFLKRLSTDDQEDYQMMMLSGIKGPDEAMKDLKENSRSDMLKLMIKATSQHNQFKFKEDTTKIFDKDAPTLSSEKYEQKSREAKTEIDEFIKERSNRARKALEQNYNSLVEKNAALKTPLYQQADLDELSKSINATAKELIEARKVTKENELIGAVNGKYLETLFNGEKSYFMIMDQIDAKKKAVEETAKGKRPDQKLPENSQKPKTVAEIQGTADAPEVQAEVDPIKADWKDAERKPPDLRDYVGQLVVSTTSGTSQAEARNLKGDVVFKIPNGSEVKRDEKDAKLDARYVQSLTYVRVSYRGKKVYIPEEQLYKRDDYYS
ncbi:hypothetical protein IT411_00875 [Candidatus Peregrinibacteria bacterium]|nr:hypothetical protein [Candidatus Peregrinibacteria bacterium]